MAENIETLVRAKSHHADLTLEHSEGTMEGMKSGAECPDNDACETGGQAHMPKVSEFYGIAIYVYYREHQPAHFHAIYAGTEAQVAIDPLGVLRGRIASRAMGLVMEWASSHQEDLRRVWDQAQAGKPLDRIAPLE